MLPVSREHLRIVQGAGGPKVCIVGSRIRVLDIVMMHEHWGWSVAQIVDQLPTINHADVHAALAYYWDHREEIEQAFIDNEKFVEEYKRTHGPGPLAEKLRQLRGDSNLPG